MLMGSRTVAETRSFRLESARRTASQALRSLNRNPNAPYRVKDAQIRRRLEAMTQTLGPLFAEQQRRLSLAREDLTKLRMQGATSRSLDDERGGWESEFRRLRRLEQKLVDFHETFEPHTAEEVAHRQQTEFRIKKKPSFNVGHGLDKEEQRGSERQLSTEVAKLHETHVPGEGTSKSRAEAYSPRLHLKDGATPRVTNDASPRDTTSSIFPEGPRDERTDRDSQTSENPAEAPRRPRGRPRKITESLPDVPKRPRGRRRKNIEVTQEARSSRMDQESTMGPAEAPQNPPGQRSSQQKKSEGAQPSSAQAQDEDNDESTPIQLEASNPPRRGPGRPRKVSGYSGGDGFG